MDFIGEMEVKDEDELKLSDYIDYEIAGFQLKKKFEKTLNHTGFVAGYLQSLMKSQEFPAISQSIQERIRHLSFLVHLMCRYDDFQIVWEEFKIVQADIEDNVTTWDDTVYFRKWEQKIINHINSEEDQNNGFNQFNDDDNVCKVELNEDDKEWKPSAACIKFTKKKLVKKKVGPKKKTRCPVCDKVVKKLDLHMKSVHPGKPVPCSECEYVAKSAYQLKKHKERLHGKVPKKRKVRDPNVKVFNCDLCDFNARLDVKLKVHQFEKHKKPLICHDCNMTFTQVDLFTQHIKQHRTTCTICGKSVINIQNHMYHMHGEESTKMEVCAHCGVSIKARAMSGHLKKVHGTKVFPCPHCQYAAKTSHDLKRHVGRKHTEANVVNCPWCGRMTKDLERHLKNNLCNIPEEEKQKLNVKMYVCNSCPKQFKTEASLLNHFKIVHEKVKDFECSLCTYKTSTNYNLKLHVKRVHEKKPLKEMCPHCENSYLNLDWHIETYHGELLLQAQMIAGT